MKIIEILFKKTLLWSSLSNTFFAGVCLGVSFALFFTYPDSVIAQQTNKEKELETQQFKDWTVQCPVTDETQKKRCILFYRVLLKNGYPLLVFQVSKSPEVDDRFIGVFDVPLGVYLPTGINVIVDETQSMQLSFERCDQNGCYAGTLMNDDILQALKKGDQGKVTFVDVANQKITASISLSGFTAGLRAL
ncbi:MAG: hypothetical protein GKR95_06130 [Gammaproteobacteria bacterium]|nr:hypothetical protein [Gammaproteobacteria bacterium]